jgi:hypothetical protein
MLIFHSSIYDKKEEKKLEADQTNQGTESISDGKDNNGKSAEVFDNGREAKAEN